MKTTKDSLSQHTEQSLTPKNAKQQRVQNELTNPTNPVIQSMTLSQGYDEKPLSAMSMLEDSRKNLIFSSQSVTFTDPYFSENNQYSIESLKELKGFLKRDYVQGTYYGQIVNEKKHGIGLMVYKDGRICEGNWQNDRKYGQCFEVMENGDQFNGEYVNGKSQGFGVHEMKDGEKFEGQWVNGFKHGIGKWAGANGDMYEGDWIFGKIDGNGIYTNTAGDKYTGSFRTNLKHGRGIEHFKNGDVYNGEYLNGKPEGEGMYLWENGNEFRGQFRNGHRHGLGKWIKWVSRELNPLTNDTVYYSYEGDYENDKKHGEGMFIWPSGNFYKGQFLNDFRHGYGEMFWVDGSHYKGMWEKGCQHGEGELYRKGQGFKQGYFENNALVNEKRPQSSSTKQPKKLVWQSHEDKQMNMSCYVLDTTNQDGSSIQQNKTYSGGREAKHNFMPSIAKKPMFLLYSQQNQFLGKTLKFSEQHSFQLDDLVDDPDFQLIQNPKRLKNLRLLNHIYKAQSKKPKDLSISLKTAFTQNLATIS